ncbi:MAG TPA: hypothetical protein DG752_08155, partial [Leeuwenhoekiella sp.]|nr:hypothetical protein [Leeuwenhoekiella sp.]
MKRLQLTSLFSLLFFILGISNSTAQSGDQMLDGIGETGLIARYIFDENTKDWSRNNLHAASDAEALNFVANAQFEQALQLTGETYLSLPQTTLNTIESLSISAWVQLNTNEKGQELFDFSSSSNTHFSAETVGDETIKIGLKQGPKSISVSIPDVAPNQWQHLVIVLDFTTQNLETYLNGRLIAKQPTAALDLNSFFDTESNKLTIGKNVNGLLHDFRIYRIPL